MPTEPLAIVLILGTIFYLCMIATVCLIAYNRKDNTPIWEAVLISLVFTPVIGLFIEACKPYKRK